MTVDKGLALLKVIDKIPMFSGLGVEDAKQILQLCVFSSVDSGDELCKEGGQSSEMFILLSGQLGVYNQERVQLAIIDPVAPVGEMGLITGQPRSATVRVISKVNLLVIKKISFDRLLRSNGNICSQVYRNVIQTLSQRLQETRLLQRKTAGEYDDREGDLRAIKEQIEGDRTK